MEKEEKRRQNKGQGGGGRWRKGEENKQDPNIYANLRKQALSTSFTVGD